MGCAGWPAPDRRAAVELLARSAEGRLLATAEQLVNAALSYDPALPVSSTLPSTPYQGDPWRRSTKRAGRPATTHVSGIGQGGRHAATAIARAQPSLRFGRALPSVLPQVRGYPLPIRAMVYARLAWYATGHPGGTVTWLSDGRGPAAWRPAAP